MASRKPTVLPVANLGDKAPYPYTSITRSPFGRLILVAGKDTVRFISIKPSGLKEVKSVRIAQVSVIFVLSYSLIIFISIACLQINIHICFYLFNF